MGWGLMSCKAIASLSCLFVLAGCTGGLVLNGAFATGDEMLTGDATRYMDGGTIEIYGTRGTHCTGTFTYLSPVEGAGRLLCDNRRSGPFVLNVLARKGWGDIDGRPFTFVLGKGKGQTREPLSAVPAS